eukprot:scaffold1903_cov396-Prasinococcus_capsulatus_cf.AAC.22
MQRQGAHKEVLQQAILLILHSLPDLHNVQLGVLARGHHQHLLHVNLLQREDKRQPPWSQRQVHQPPLCPSHPTVGQEDKTGGSA